MKKSIFTIVIWIGILMSMSAQQSECKFPMDSTIWSQMEVYNSEIAEQVIIGTTNDSVVDGLTYYKLYLMADTTYSSEDMLIGLIRKDGYKIYLRQDDCDKPIDGEILLYDFYPDKLEVKYSFAACRPNNEYWNPYIVHINNYPIFTVDQYGYGTARSIESTLKDGNRIVRLQPTSNPYAPDIVWNEMYGCSDGFFGTFCTYDFYLHADCSECGYIAMRRGRLGCVKHKDDILYLDNQLTSCFDKFPLPESDIVVSETELSDSDLKLDVLMNKGILTINTLSPVDKLLLFSIKGELICETEENEMDIRSVANGIYLLSIVQGDKHITKKIRIF